MRVAAVLPEQPKPLPIDDHAVRKQRDERNDVNDDYDHRHVWYERHKGTLEPAACPKREVFGLGCVKKFLLRTAVTLATREYFGASVTASLGDLCFTKEPAQLAKL